MELFHGASQLLSQAPWLTPFSWETLGLSALREQLKLTRITLAYNHDIHNILHFNGKRLVTLRGQLLKSVHFVQEVVPFTVTDIFQHP